ncbi:MAG: hypothetical protein JWQ94_3854 [Tardiphaga sp.]|jgi:hypothetical protein|nr:hypothetical protein [Tardiphaga sp.]
MTDPVTSRNVVDFLSYQQARRTTAEASVKTQPIAMRSCRHCGAGMMDGESDDDCSSLSATEVAPRRSLAE